MEDDENAKAGPSIVRRPETMSRKPNQDINNQIREDRRSTNVKSRNHLKLGNRSNSAGVLGVPRFGRGISNNVQMRNTSIQRKTVRNFASANVEFRGGLSGTSQIRLSTRGHRDYNSSNRRESNSQERSQEDYRSSRFVGFLALKRVADSDVARVLTSLHQIRTGFMNVINSPINDRDIIVVIIEILAKLTQSPFEERKSKIIVDVCNSNFICSLRNYLTDLPYAEEKRKNRLYWTDQEKFWTNFTMFIEDIVNLSPDTAARTCRALIESVAKTCLEALHQSHDFTLEEKYTLKLNEIREKIISYVNRGKKIYDADTKTTNVGDNAGGEVAPPQDFHELSVIPTREDLLGAPAFLRPNITAGGYTDVEHYLDVQFRLLREDCFGPIRVGIEQFLENPSKRKFDYVRVYRNVKFMGPYVSNLKVGHLVQVDNGNNNYFKRVNWAHSKRFLFGSLVFFTKDRFRDCIMATILDRDNMLLAMGRIPVTVIHTSFGVQINSEDTYTMIESEVYFEPYYHVLRALQSPSLVTHLPMQEYIVKVNVSSRRPAYLTDNTMFSIPANEKPIAADVPKSQYDEEISAILEAESCNQIHFYVSKPESWPPKEDLQFNESQYEAYKLALTHEFAVIQGPPGTGKTYVGLKVAEALLRNVKADRNCYNNCIMLVVCYTNHALDQFLEGISKVTKHIVRIGSQSRNKAMDEYNLINIRKLRDIEVPGISSDFMEAKRNLKQTIQQFQEAMTLLDILNNGVVKSNIVDTIPEVELLCKYYSRYNIKDPIAYWLFENCEQYNGDFNECISEYEAIEIDSNDNEYDIKRKENLSDVILTDDKDTIEFVKSLKMEYASFLLIESKLKLKELVTCYIKDNKQKENTTLIDCIQMLNSQIRLYDDMMNYRFRAIRMDINPSTDFSKITTQNRWRLYFTWIRKKVRSLEGQIADFQDTLTSAVTSYDEARMMFDMELLRNKNIKVLGMTTSGAARMRKLIHAISPKIVIVEEAAEVLEQHIITSLPKTCQHLILIGDHQQLRPSASYMKLVKKYNIEVSLFERMITNGMHSRRLDIQHRMRPEIAALISPHIYPNLENHPTVENYGDVLGLEKSVFFFSHDHEEESNVNDSTSRTNPKEGDIILALANYLIQQGYKGDEVTILAAYSGQMFYMRKERKKYVHLSDVKITVVDNYQGEESRIILLSLVRNNPENNIGFLGIENRICVALSRAKQGFYMFGNINMLKIKSDLWTKIAAILEKNGSLGSKLNLKCQNHPEQITSVETVKDFEKTPEGGCIRICNFQYKCGHQCVRLCHGYDLEHKDAMKCPYKCERIICELNHVCPLRCHEDCKPCTTLVPKMLPCGHEEPVFCHREPDDPRNKCKRELEVTLPRCGHKAKKFCYQDVADVKCQEKCKMRLEKCGHTCEGRCHVGMSCSDTNYSCKKDCARANKGCQAELTDDLGDHQCKKKCYEECAECNVQVKKRRTTCKHNERLACSVKIDDTPCKKNCTRLLTCGHFCKLKCADPCGDCKIMVKKVIPDCNHEINIMCKIVPTKGLCYNKCSRTMSCGHRCMGRCGVDCDQAECTQLTIEKVDSPCGHKTALPCNLYAKFLKGELDTKEMPKYCNYPCGEILACQHICSGSCSTCYQGRLHIPCQQTCNQLNICGHKCQEPCNQMCPPCKMPCEIECEHSRCSRLCGQPCQTCKEKCDRSCPHGTCRKLCWQKCSREACSLPCPLSLPCGHRCRGLCGETCPDICNVCRPEQFPTGFIGEEYEEDDKFILLQDCGHIVELESMDSIMMGHQEIIKMRECPYCRKPVTNTNRYKDLVNDLIKNNINPIKRRVYGQSAEIKNKYTELQNKILAISTKYFQEKNHINPRLMLDAKMRSMFMRFTNFVHSKKKLFILEVEMFTIYCVIFEMILECWEAYANTKSSKLEEEFQNNVEMILKVLKIDFIRKKLKVEVKISEQQQKDIANEIKRLNVIVQLAKLLHIAIPMMNLQIKSCAEAATKAVLTLTVFDEENALKYLKTLQTTIKASDIVTKTERQMIVKAMAFKAGHWFKCPNGHFYCIGDCGGANQVGKCPECGESIGGTGHRLLPGNSHAREMDGSQFPAYSEQANAMANFLLDEI